VRKDVIFEEEIAFRRSKEYQMDIDSEKVHFPHSTVQRETTIVPVNPVDLVDVPRDIAVGHKMPYWAQKTLQEVEGHAAPRGTF
jgi:hypothetical protein